MRKLKTTPHIKLKPAWEEILKKVGGGALLTTSKKSWAYSPQDLLTQNNVKSTHTWILPFAFEMDS